MTGDGQVLEGPPAVPWRTVLPLAVVMAYADGFLLVSLRGSVGAVGRAQSPFESWLRESTLGVPLFALAVLAALVVALARYGPVLRTPRTVVGTCLYVVLAGTLAAVVLLAASAAYDHHLQATAMPMMASPGACPQCQEFARQGSLSLQWRAVGIGTAMLLLTNVVVVGWTVALRGARVDLGGAVRRDRDVGARFRRSVPRPVLGDPRLVLVVGLLADALVHVAVAPEHLAEWPAAGVFFLVLAAAQAVVAVALVVRPQARAALLAAAAVSAGPLALWLVSRTFGTPFGPDGGATEPFGVSDSAAAVLEIATLVIALWLGRRARGVRRPMAHGPRAVRDPGSATGRVRRVAVAHLGRLAVVAIITVAAIGLAGSGLAPFDVIGSSGTPPGVVRH